MGQSSALHPSRKVSFWLLPLGVVLAFVALGLGLTRALLPPCPFHQLTGFDCPGCGSTRAITALLHGHFLQALDFNLLSIPALVMLAIGYAQQFVPALQALWLRLNKPKTVLIVVLAFWVLRNLPLPPFLWLSAAH
ncbi:MAG: DUF2752 domain-containing protein [Bacteroidetes bacterium]|nr:DUF2752 domain-containing protein [Bacteroidota bacterium]MBS1629806.1 DUF2752 domain-containing protein [Bacteroidota bacterium]